MLALIAAACAVGAFAAPDTALSDDWVESGTALPLRPASPGPLLVAIVAPPSPGAERPPPLPPPPSLPRPFHCLVQHWGLLLPGITALWEGEDGHPTLPPALLDQIPASHMPTAPTLRLYAAEFPGCDAVRWFSLPASALADDTDLPALRDAFFAPPASPPPCNATCVLACERGRCRALDFPRPAAPSPPPPPPLLHASLALLGGGQHRKLAVSVYRPRLAPGWVLVALPLPPGAFVDDDELAGLERAGRLCRDPNPPDPPCDIEAPSYEARPCPALVALPTGGGALEPIPLHLRYHAPAPADRPAKAAVALPPPTLHHLAAPVADPGDERPTTCSAFRSLRRRHGAAPPLTRLPTSAAPLVAHMPVGRREDAWPTLVGTAAAVLVAVTTLLARGPPAW